MDRDLAIGVAAAIALHVGLGVWATTIERWVPPAPEPRVVAKAVYEEIKLPEPEPPPPPPPPPEPAPEPVPTEVTKPDPAPTPTVKPKRRPKPKAPPKDQPPPANEPAPLVLSKTYGATANGGGVAVQTGDEDRFGDPAVEATERNRRRRENDGDAGTPTAAAAATVAAKKVVIVHARPRRRGGCEVEWPKNAPSGRRVVEVTLLLSIGSTGKVTPSRILRSAGEPFDSAARAALSRCAFEPGTRDGVPMADKVPFVVEFKPGSDA